MKAITGVSEEARAVVGEEVKRRRYTFAELMKRVFNINILICPACKSKRELIAMITESKVIRAILECLDLPPDPPPVQPARRPP